MLISVWYYFRSNTRIPAINSLKTLTTVYLNPCTIGYYLCNHICWLICSFRKRWRKVWWRSWDLKFAHNQVSNFTSHWWVCFLIQPLRHIRTCFNSPHQRTIAHTHVVEVVKNRLHWRRYIGVILFLSTTSPMFMFNFWVIAITQIWLGTWGAHSALATHLIFFSWVRVVFVLFCSPSFYHVLWVLVLWYCARSFPLQLDK